MSSVEPPPPGAGAARPWGRVGGGAFNPALKVLLIGLLVLGLLIPLTIVHDLVRERAERYQIVVAEIGRLWGDAQRLTGPLMVIPFRETVTDSEGVTRVVADSLVLLPDRYAVRGTVVPEVRRRGLFEAVVYRADLAIDGAFGLPDLREDGRTYLWDEATLVLALSDQRSIRQGVTAGWGEATLPLMPGAPVALARLLAGGMHAQVPGLSAADPGAVLPFSLSLGFNGSGSLSFVPLGRENSVSIESPWSAPSFVGNILPDTHAIDATGFQADWTVSNLGRGYPQSWRGGQTASYAAEVDASAYGVRFFQPVSAYHQTERAAKYGILFGLFTFGLFFLFEMIGGLRLHIFQYGLVGLSLCLFYLLLLALSEHVGFAVAYAVGAAAVVGQIVLYAANFLGRRWRVGVLGVLLAALYAGLYALLRLEDQALLFGAIALFAALSAVMIATRKVDWYAIRLAPDGAGAARNGG